MNKSNVIELEVEMRTRILLGIAREQPDAL